MSRDSLLREKLIWKKLADEIQQQPEYISALEIINEWEQCFSRLSDFLLRMRADMAVNAARRILNVRRRVGKPYGQLCVAFVPAGEVPRVKLDIQMKWLPEEMASLVVESATSDA